MKCPGCAGTGRDDNYHLALHECERCKGTGSIAVEELNPTALKQEGQMTTTKLSEKDALIIEIMSLGYKANLTTDYAVFINYAGHVDTLDIAVSRSKEDYQITVAQGHFSLKRSRLEAFEKVRDRLQRLLETGDITACGMTAVPECHDLFIL